MGIPRGGIVGWLEGRAPAAQLSDSPEVEIQQQQQQPPPPPPEERDWAGRETMVWEFFSTYPTSLSGFHVDVVMHVRLM